MPSLPDFFLFAAPKSGTSSVYSFLDQHPEIFVSPVKEPDFFSNEGVPPSHKDVIPDFDSYQALFAGSEGKRAVGEGSVGYLGSLRAAEGIFRRIPEARFIGVLRQPVERAYSHWHMSLSKGGEKFTDFKKAVSQPVHSHQDHGDSHPALGMRYLAGGLYHFKLSRYLRWFPRERFHIVLYEDLKKDPEGMMRGIYEFLGVDPGFVPDTSRRIHVTVSTAPREGPLGRLLSPPGAVKDLLRPLVPTGLRKKFRKKFATVAMQPSHLPSSVRREFTPLFHDDIAALGEWLSRDLSAWTK